MLMITVTFVVFAIFWALLLLQVGGVFSLRQLPLGLRSVRYLQTRPHHADTHHWSYQQLSWAVGLCFGTFNAHLGPSTRFSRDLKKIFRKREGCPTGKYHNLPEVVVYYQESSSSAWQRTALLRFTNHPRHPTYGVEAVYWIAHVIYSSGESLMVTSHGDVITVSELGERAGALLGVNLWKGASVTERCNGILGDVLALTGNQTAVQFCQRLLVEGTDNKGGRGLQLNLNY